MKQTAPFRFLVVVVGSWVAFRLVVLLPDWTSNAGQALQSPGVEEAEPTTAAEVQPTPESLEPTWALAAPSKVGPSRALAFGSDPQPVRLAGADEHPSSAILFLPRARGPEPSAALIPIIRAQPVQARAEPISPAAFPALPLPTGSASRWSGSAWVFARDGSGVALAPGGVLGAGQAGARVTYRIAGGAHRPLALSRRIYAPLDQPEGAEVALGSAGNRSPGYLCTFWPSAASGWVGTVARISV